MCRPDPTTTTQAVGVSTQQVIVCLPQHTLVWCIMTIVSSHALFQCGKSFLFYFLFNDSSFNLDECCVNIKVYYEIKNEAYYYQSMLYGTYTKLLEGVNGCSHYQSDFNDGGFGIWSCGATWQIDFNEFVGNCTGYAYAFNTDVKCAHNVGWLWSYWNYEAEAFSEAGKGLGVVCTGMH